MAKISTRWKPERSNHQVTRMPCRVETIAPVLDAAYLKGITVRMLSPSGLILFVELSLMEVERLHMGADLLRREIGVRPVAAHEVGE